MIRKIKLTLRNVLTESMTIHTNQENTNLTDILYELNKKIKEDLIELMGEKGFSKYNGNELISYDGSTYPNDIIGILNFYTWNLPTQLINYVTKIIVEYLNQNDVNVEISNIEKSQAKPSNVIRLNITGNDNPKNNDINLSNANARFIFTQIINYTNNEYQQCIERGYFDVGELKTKVEIASTTLDPSDFADTNSEITSYNMKSVFSRLNDIKTLIEYCETNNIEQLHIY